MTMKTRSPNAGRGFPKGHTIPAHFHLNDHTAVFSNGRWRIVKRAKEDFDGRLEWGNAPPVLDEIIEAPHHLLVRGREWHEFTYLGQSVPEWMGPYLDAMSEREAAAFRDAYENAPGYIYCVFPGEDE